jgi:hypothetical protein
MTTLIPKFDLMNGGSTSTGAINRAINLKLSDVISVKDFGATGDGATDDTAAIQAAINYGQTVVGSNALTRNATIYFPPGVYVTSASLTVSYPMNLIGDSSVTSVIQPTSALTAPALVWGVNGTTPRPGYGVVIEKLGFNGANTTSSSAHGIKLYCSHTEVKDCAVYSFSGHGIYAIDSWSNLIQHNWINANKLDGIHLDNACNSFVISANYILGSLNNGIQIQGGNKIVVEGNDIEGNYYNGVYVFPGGVNPVRSCQIQNNYFERNNLAGSHYHINISRNGSEISNINVVYNYFENDGATSCIYVNGCNNGTIISNQTTNGYLYYPQAEGENVYSFNNNPATTANINNLVYNPNIYENKTEGVVVNGRLSRFAVNSQEVDTSGTLWSVQGRYAANPFPSFTIGTTTQTYGTAAPTTGANVVGNIVWNTAPTAGGNIGWVCVTAGTPGTWKTFGAIAA